MPSDAELRDMIQASRPPESHAWDRMRATPGGCQMTIAEKDGTVTSFGYHWDIPRDAWNALFRKFGEARALIEIESPERPFAGIAICHQPDKCLDAWERWVASLS